LLQILEAIEHFKNTLFKANQNKKNNYSKQIKQTNSSTTRRTLRTLRTLGTSGTRTRRRMSKPKPMPPVYELNCAAAFEGLTQKERLYAHHLSNACYLASPIVLFQTSRESPLLFVFLITLFKHQDLEVSEELRSYAAEVFSNMGNYKSFGDTKITPENVLNEIEKLVELVEKQDSSSGINKLWSSVKPFILNTSEEADHLAFPPSGSTSYYSPNCQKEDAALVQQFMDEKGALFLFQILIFKVLIILSLIFDL